MNRLRTVVAVAPWLVAAGAFAASTPAAAAPPSAESFEITYFETDADGQPLVSPMNVNDLQSYANRARCECGQLINARVRYLTTMGAPDNVQVRTFVGNQCDQGQGSFNPQFPPCVLALDGFTNLYTQQNPPRISFQPIWLAHGIERNGEQDIESATAAGNCQNGQGNAGVWVCVENGSQTDCQAEEFVISGSQNSNVPDGEEQQGFSFDFQPPSVTVQNFEAEGGDGSLLVTWDQTSTSDVQGFRVLCADANGDPLPGHGFAPDGPNRGTFYYTTQNVCPDGPFNAVPEGEAPQGGGGPFDPSTTGDSGTGGNDTDGGSTGFGVADHGATPHGGGGECCLMGPGPGCTSASCEYTVCVYNPACCDIQWSQTCADLAADLCPECGGAGDCCLPNATAGCYDDSCQTQVCADNPSCCTVEWSQACADAADACSVCQTPDPTGGATTTGAGTGGTDSSGTDGTGTDGDTTGGTSLPSTGIESLDWGYVCSGHLPANTNRARVTGLSNGQQYQVLVIAYDRAGNPTAASGVLVATPQETTDLWEQCEGSGDICGDGGFCSCRTDRPQPAAGLALALLGLLGLTARRRR
jgi:MYXO-CTERM domain-containing protein